MRKRKSKSEANEKRSTYRNSSAIEQTDRFEIDKENRMIVANK